MDKKSVAILSAAAAVCAYGTYHFTGMFDNNLNLIVPLEDAIGKIPDLLSGVGGLAVIMGYCDEYFHQKKAIKTEQNLEKTTYSDISMG